MTDEDNSDEASYRKSCVADTLEYLWFGAAYSTLIKHNTKEGENGETFL